MVIILPSYVEPDLDKSLLTPIQNKVALSDFTFIEASPSMDNYKTKEFIIVILLSASLVPSWRS